MILGDEEGVRGDDVEEGEEGFFEEDEGGGGEDGEFTGDGDSTVTTGGEEGMGDADDEADERAAMTDFMNSITAGSVVVVVAIVVGGVALDFTGVFEASFPVETFGAFSFCCFGRPAVRHG